MSFLYPRTISVRRPATQSGEGQLGYGGQTAASDSLVASGLPANIELRREGQKSPVATPGDGTMPMYDIRIPKGSAALGLIKNLDVIVDDQGERYKVVGPNWNSLGYAIRAELLAP